jgi:Fic family protein
MEKISHQEWPEIVFGTSDSAQSQAIRRALHAAQLRKIAPRLYTSNLTDKPSVIVARNSYHILGELFPGAVISHRSALEGGISSDGLIILTYKYTKKLSLPGLIIRLIAGKEAQEGDMPFMNNLFMASRARALLENLQPSRSKDGIKKTLSRERIEELLDKLCRVYSYQELNLLRDQAKQLAKKLNMRNEFKILNHLIGALLGSKPADLLTTDIAQARAKGQAYDITRLELFAKLLGTLKKEILPILKDKISSAQELRNLAFFESYFSNFIEGTEFEVDEAQDIIFHHKHIHNRPEDAHDILATYRIVSNTQEMSHISQSADELIFLLKKRHAVLMEARTDKQPGQFKTIANRVGNTLFVNPELVEGTLRKVYSLYENIEIGMARAIFMMFIITEIHPFLDGNGRIARIMMNAELVHARQSRIIIPTVYREDYILALRRLSNSSDAEPYIRMLLRAQAFTASLDYSEYNKTLFQLNKSNAFMQPNEGKLIFPQ